jgi:hypothetical protein
VRQIFRRQRHEHHEVQLSAHQTNSGKKSYGELRQVDEQHQQTTRLDAFGQVYWNQKRYFIDTLWHEQSQDAWNQCCQHSDTHKNGSDHRQQIMIRWHLQTRRRELLQKIKMKLKYFFFAPKRALELKLQYLN